MKWIKLASNPWLKHNASNDFLIENEVHGIKGPFKCLPVFDPYWPSDPLTIPHHFLGLVARAQSWSIPLDWPLTTLTSPAVTSLPVWPVLVPTASCTSSSASSYPWPVHIPPCDLRPQRQFQLCTVLYFLFGGRGRPTPYLTAGFGMFRLNWIVVSFGMFLKPFHRRNPCKH